MAIGFSPRVIITNPDELFGRKDILDQLISLANNRYSVSITGLRRFGKTSLLKCVETSLRTNPESKAYPIYFDFKEVGSIIKGTDNVYKYMISCLVTRLFSDKYFIGEATFKKTKIKAASDWEDIFESLINVNTVRIQGLFEEIVSFFSEYLDKTILFLIDEYEWLFRFSFDQPVGFMKLRNFSSRVAPNGINAFSFWIAGATSWDYLCTITGSGELNVIDAPPMYLGSIDQESFLLMWEKEISNLESCSETLKNSNESAYHASGGIPFYGKLIGGHIHTAGTPANFNLFKPHFQELLDSLQTEEKDILLDLAKLPRNYKNMRHVHELLQKGLIKKNGNNYELNMGFLKEYLNSDVLHVNNSSHETMPESQILADKINMLISNINKTHKNKRGSYIFEPVVDEAALSKDLRTPCYSLELFSDFASSIYKVIFERTKDFDQNKQKDVNLQKLPKQFKNKNQFISIIDTLRHTLGKGHLEDMLVYKTYQMKKSTMLNILTGTKNEPSQPHEFYAMQISLLKMFEKELNSLSKIVQAFA